MSQDWRGKGSRQHYVHNFWNNKAKTPYTVKLIPAEDSEDESEQRPTFKVDESGENIQFVPSRVTLKKRYAKAKEKVKEVFLPADYPQSVRAGYLPFTLYTGVTQVSITAMQFMST